MKKYAAELVGTFVLVFGGVGSAVLAGSHIGFSGVAFAFGLSLLAMVYTIGPISGCHINPAVTLGVLLAKKIDAKDAAAYVVAQIIGAVIASACVLFVANGAAAAMTWPQQVSAPMDMERTPRGSIPWRLLLWQRSFSRCFLFSPCSAQRISKPQSVSPVWPLVWS